MSSMNPCKRYQTDIALFAGHDLEEAAEKQVRRHLAECLSCREYAARLQSSLQVLERSAAHAAAVELLADSLWPDVRAALLQKARRHHAGAVPVSGLRNWLPVSALAAACVAIWISSQSSLPPHWPQDVEKFSAAVAEGVPDALSRVSLPSLDSVPRFPWRETAELGRDSLQSLPRISLDGALPSQSLPSDWQQLPPGIKLQPVLHVERF